MKDHCGVIGGFELREVSWVTKLPPSGEGRVRVAFKSGRRITFVKLIVEI